MYIGIITLITLHVLHKEMKLC